MRRGVNLKAKLDAYEASSAVVSGAAAKKRQRTWPVYAAAAGSGLAMATSAEAGIVYSGPQNVTAGPIPTGGSGLTLKTAKLNIDGLPVFNIIAEHDTSLGPHGGVFLHGNSGGTQFGHIISNGSGTAKRLAHRRDHLRRRSLHVIPSRGALEDWHAQFRHLAGGPDRLRGDQVHQVRRHSLRLDPARVDQRNRRLPEQHHGARLGVQRRRRRFDPRGPGAGA